MYTNTPLNFLANVFFQESNDAFVRTGINFGAIRTNYLGIYKYIISIYNIYNISILLHYSK